MSAFVDEYMAWLKAKNPAEPEFHQAAQEVAESLEVVLDKNPKYRDAKILERISEPERVIMFRVPWVDDKGEVQINRGFRIEMNSAIGPYKGGMRFHPTVYLGLLKFLAFEQVFKNSLTTLPMGGGKGGSDFDPKGKSDNEVMRFCQSLMTELCRHIGQFTDVPAGDIGVGGREIGFMFGQYKRVRNEFVGVLTGKGLNWGGSLDPSRGDRLRRRVLRRRDAHHARRDPRGQDLPRQRLRQRGPVRHREDPRPRRQARHLLATRAATSTTRPASIARSSPSSSSSRTSSAAASASTPTSSRAPSTRPSDKAKDFNPLWDHKAECAFPSATQNEINAKDAANLLKNGVYVVSEGANMPTVPEGVNLFVEKGILYGPGKAANAGGVATSGLEMSQNSLRLSWTREEVDARLHGIMKAIHRQCVDASAAYGMEGNYVAGANIAGFLKVADSMLDQGVV